MQYQYYNQFNLSPDLAQAISFIISKMEGASYICKILNIIIPKHKELFYTASTGDGISQIEGIIPAKDYAFLVVMNSEVEENFSLNSFERENDMKKALECLCEFYHEYDGIFDPRDLYQKFPYLKDFFDRLDIWRANTGRVTLDADILEDSIRETLNNNMLKAGR